MSTDLGKPPTGQTAPPVVDEFVVQPFSWTRTLRWIVSPLASLKLTVALMALAILIVLFGTLAQVEMDIWQVVHEYFRRPWYQPFAWVPMRIFFPPTFFHDTTVAETITIPLIGKTVPFGFYFPSGWLIGGAMTLNLLAAHTLRFKIQARGMRLWYGLGVISFGVLVTLLVVLSGWTRAGFQDSSWLDGQTLWSLFEAGLVLLWLANGYVLLKSASRPSIERWGLLAVSVVLGGILGWLFYEGDAVRMNGSSMRILWQLIKGAFAGVVLLAGCVMVFRKRAGIVLLHAGIGLMMLSELLVGTSASEGQMTIREGETVNFVRDIRELELAIIDPSNPKEDDVVVVPLPLLHDKKTVLQQDHPDLPFDIELVKFTKNIANLRRLKPGEATLATQGTGKEFTIEEARAGTGTDTGGQVDMPAAYIRLSHTGDSEKKGLGTFLVSLIQTMNETPEHVTVGGKTYELWLRFKRVYKPYSMYLIDVRKDDYLGTDTPRNYSSDVQLVDKKRHVNRKVHIWMNNPLRFSGETFYQSNYFRDPKSGKEITTLQVVTNTGWMIPYVACMIVAIGMLAQFSGTLLRFVDRLTGTSSRGATTPTRTERDISKTAAKRKKHRPKKPQRLEIEPAEALGGRTGLSAVVLPTIAVVLCGAWILGKARPVHTPDDQMQIAEFGRLPVVYEGRVKPFDTLARNALRIISGKETFKDETGQTQPAIRWLLDLISGADAAEKHKVFRIDHPDVLDTLDLKERQGFRYSIEELRPKSRELAKQAQAARKLPKDELSSYQRKLIQTDNNVRLVTKLLAAFRPPALPAIPTEQEFKANRQEAMRRMRMLRQALMEEPKRVARLAASNPPLAVPVRAEHDHTAQDDPTGTKKSAEVEWLPYSTAWTRAYTQVRILGKKKPDPATVAMNTILVSYAKGNVDQFNEAVAGYYELLNTNPPKNYAESHTDIEAFFNHFEPFYYSSLLYFFAGLVALLAWLLIPVGGFPVLRRTALAMIVLTFLVHTFALGARMYISGRPPVTNLYSSAVFIGWGGVVFGVVLELIFRLGIGNAIAAVAGFSTLLIAHFLSGDGDTFTVLQAVLDTQFWLATHVVCITLGYATTFVAGLLGVVYVLGGLFTPALGERIRTETVGRMLGKMIYGVLCFAIFFSFVGTVLGGLWADDSWGRFWGWDPKENGALIIVLWNALVLHARWSGMVKQRGLAVLAIGGNIVTSWSWFGVNQLGKGLHSYGFTQGIVLALGLFVVSQMVIIAAGMLPTSLWRSFRRKPAT